MSERRILILEDEILIALDMQMTLQEAGFTNITVCNSLQKAWDYIATETPDLAFTDLNLGKGTTSFEIGEELVSRGCEVVILSGYSSRTVAVPPSLAHSKRLPKPFDHREILALAAA